MCYSQGPVSSRENYMPKAIFVCFNVVIRVSVNGKGFVAMLLWGLRFL